MSSRRLDIVKDLDVEEVLSDLRKPQNREISDALEYIQNVLGGRTYVEDSHGRILFAPVHRDPDDWRSDYTPLAAPTSAKSVQVLEAWRRRARPYALLNGDQSLEFRRCVIPLVYHGTVFAFVHLVDSFLTPSAPTRNSEQLTAAIADRIFMLVFATMNEFRAREIKDCIPPQRASSQLPLAESGSAAVSKVHIAPPQGGHVCIAVSFPSSLAEAPGGRVVVDYPSIVLRAGRILAETVQCLCPAITHLHPEASRKEGQIDLHIQMRMSGSLRLNVVALAIEHALKQLGWQMKVGLGALLGEEPANYTAMAANDYVAREAATMLAIADPRDPGPKVITRADSAAHSLLRMTEESSSFRTYATYIRQKLVDESPLLEETARVYAESECSVSAAARELQVNRRTVTYRLRRISEIVGLDLPTFAAKTLLHLIYLPRD